MVSGGVLRKKEFGAFGSQLFGGSYGWNEIVDFLIATWNHPTRCIDELERDVFYGFWFVKNLLIGPSLISSCIGLTLLL